jgi:hypothetical protein
MPAKPLMIVSLTVDPEKEAEFNSFYHHRYIPKLLSVVPEIVSARRYEEFNVEGSLRWYVRQYLTIYEIASDDAIPAAIEGLGRPGREAEREEWERWSTSHLHKIERHCYRARYAHRRTPPDGAFAGRPFFMVSVELREEARVDFDRWYESEYLPANLAEVPTWAACRRYSSVDRVPARHLTIYEAPSSAGLSECLGLMRAPWRLAENASWQRWDRGTGPAISWEDAASFRPIYRFPD